MGSVEFVVFLAGGADGAESVDDTDYSMFNNRFNKSHYVLTTIESGGDTAAFRRGFCGW